MQLQTPYWSFMSNRILSLTCAAIALALITLAPSTAQAQAPGYSSTTSIVAVRVPSFVKVVVDQQAESADGAPVIQVITNDPAIRNSLANGLTPEVVRVAIGAQMGDAQRYTIVQP
jgi:hypothetical protein